MSAPQPIPNPAALHGMLTGGLVIIALGVAYVLFGRSGPLLGTDPGSAVIGYAMAAAALLGVVGGGVVLRGRIPPRPASQPVAAYWQAPATLQAALLLWVLVEGSGVIAMVGWLLTGNLAAMASGLVAIGVLVLFSPGSLAGR